MNNYPIGDFLIRVKNAYMANKKEISVPHTKAIFAIAQILEQEGYIKNVKVEEVQEDPKKMKQKVVSFKLIYKKNTSALSDVRIISRPSVHWYVNKTDLQKLLRNYGTSILSTNKGFMTGKKAVQEGVGGELICQIS